ncbi:adenylate kinase family protein [Candidatus Woesearchaeota archaeon]|nr:adenylate kinase family protein [Candidatus Woesearchaeota archaeon]
MKTVLVTGTPGTGKTVIAKKLSLLLNYAYFDVAQFIKKAHLYSKYDRKRACYVVEAKKLVRELLKVREKALKRGEKGIIFDSHMSHFLPCSKADLCIVTRCALKTLSQRLTKRGYSKSKIRENLDAEIFDTCLVEAVDNRHKIVAFDTTKKKNFKLFSKRIIRILNRRP